MLGAQLKSMVKHISVYGASRILSRAVGFLMIPMYTRFLTPADYGTIEIIDLTLTVIGLMIASGVNNSIFKFYFKYQDAKDRDQVVSTAIATVAAMGLAVELLAFLGLGRFTQALFGSSEYEKYLAMALVSFYFNLLSDIPLGYLRAQQRSRLYVTVSLARLAVEVGLNLYFVAVLRMGIAGVMTTQLISAIVFSTILLWTTFSKVGFSVSLPKSLEMLRFGIPLIPTAVGVFVVNNGDKYFLKHFSGLEAVGIYALAFKFGYMLNYLVTQPFALVWDGKMYEIGDKPDAPVLYGRIFTWVITVLCCVGLAMSLFAQHVVDLMAHGKFKEAGPIIPIIVLAYVFQACYHYFQVGLYLKSRTDLLGMVIFACGVFTLLLFWALIPPFGAFGAAAATALSFLTMAVAVFFAARKYYRVEYEYRRVALLIGAAIGIFLLSRSLGPGLGHWQITVNFLACVLYPVSLHYLGFFTEEEKRAAMALVRRARAGIAGA